MDWNNLKEAIFYSFLAGFGGAIGDVMRKLNSNKDVVWKRTAVEAFGAAFVGYLVYQVCVALGLSREWTGVVVGVCGWLGSSATIQILEPVVKRVIGAKDHADK